MAKKGRKRIYDDPMDPCNIMLTPYQRRKARRLGDGNRSKGVRKALDDTPMPEGKPYRKSLDFDAN